MDKSQIGIDGKTGTGQHEAKVLYIFAMQTGSLSQDQPFVNPALTCSGAIMVDDPLNPSPPEEDQSLTTLVEGAFNPVKFGQNVADCLLGNNLYPREPYGEVRLILRS